MSGLSPAGRGAVGTREFRTQSFEQAVGESGCVQDFAEQQEGAPGVLVTRDLDKDFADRRVVRETLRAVQQPDIELTFGGAEVGGGLRVIALGVVHQEAWVHLEEARQQSTRGLRHVWTLAALDLREVGLADGLAGLGVNALLQLLLRKGPIQAAERTFDLAKVANFFTHRHICQIALIVSQYEILSSTGVAAFAMGYAGFTERAQRKKPPR